MVEHTLSFAGRGGRHGRSEIEISHMVCYGSIRRWLYFVITVGHVKASFLKPETGWGFRRHSTSRTTLEKVAQNSGRPKAVRLG